MKKEILAQVFSCEFYEISKNTFLHRTPLVADSKFCFIGFKRWISSIDFPVGCVILYIFLPRIK